MIKELTEQELQELNECEPRITFKCKPCYNFQSIEFEITTGDLEEVKAWYQAVVEMLMEIAPAQPNDKIVADPATDKQKEILKKYGITFKANISKEEANKLIQKSMGK